MVVGVVRFAVITVIVVTVVVVRLGDRRNPRLALLGGAHAEAELARPADHVLERGLARRRGGARPAGPGRVRAPSASGPASGP